MTTISKSNLLLNTLVMFFQKDNNLEKIIPIISSQSKISLRVLDWFVTNYSKKLNINYKLKNTTTNDIMNFCIYNDYKLQLKAYNKRFFDPFCRGPRIIIKFELNRKIIKIKTTIGQLNFFRWSLTNNIIEYVNNNLDAINIDINKNYKFKKNSDSLTQTDEETTLTNNSLVNTHSDIDINIDFDN